MPLESTHQYPCAIVIDLAKITVNPTAQRTILSMKTIVSRSLCTFMVDAMELNPNTPHKRPHILHQNVTDRSSLEGERAGTVPGQLPELILKNPLVHDNRSKEKAAIEEPVPF
ncbi:MAG: hypothetical protein A2428_05735 [Bdellovibrionales bacterium RIFOXYC1_FULL_54_43]|nr:MAG: hypothetical protein A2428_05735 [Bdellovibrionales bacterium RIFOXYC1_FULL_54_43]OFZ82634.1 MAG: hypothetical protein A2603_02350 [Bdellovibrionales bacterium RIFOXYD1_FULL_55_31]